MRTRDVFLLWFPLAVSFVLMMFEEPVVQTAIGFLSDPPLNLAAWGLTFQMALIFETPMLMLMATSITLVRDRQAFGEVRRFVLRLCMVCTALSALVAFTPLFDLFAGWALGYPQSIIDAARPSMQLMTLWAAAIGWRRFFQGILVRHGFTKMLTYGTMIRLALVTVAVASLTAWGLIPGANAAGIAVMAAVIVEAVASTLFARRVVKYQIKPHETGKPMLTQMDILRFHLPLAASTVLTLAATPMTSAALARLDTPTATLAVWPVVFTLVMVMRGWGMALQELSVSLGQRPDASATLKRFSVFVTVGVTLVAGAALFTPLLDLYLVKFLHLPQPLAEMAWQGMLASLFIPAVTAVGCWVRGVLVAGGATREVYVGMIVNVLCHGLFLLGGVALGAPGMWVAAMAFTLAGLAEYVYLVRAAKAMERGKQNPARRLAVAG